MQNFDWETTAALVFETPLAPAEARAGEPFTIAPATFAKLKKGGVVKGGGAIINRLQTKSGLRFETDLNTVGSEANWFEAALKARLAETPDLPYPRVTVRFPSSGGNVSVLDLPHRSADAWLRNTTIYSNGPHPHDMRPGQLHFEDDCTAIFEQFPIDLLFGFWASGTGSGRQNSRLARSVVSRITGITEVSDGDITLKAAAQRQDPLIKGTTELYYNKESHDAGGPMFTVDKDRGSDWSEADIDKKDRSKLKTPSGHNFGDVPSERENARVFLDRARQTTTISLTALRRLHFPTAEGSASPKRDRAAHDVLFALALLCYALRRQQGYFLRSGCDLIPYGESRFEIVHTDGKREAFALPAVADAETAYRKAVERAALQDLRFAANRIVEAPPELNRNRATTVEEDEEPFDATRS
ncbi:MAG: type I-G CRISPR-associated RAMP protein Csb1/Cas7g [Vulcanimicrobiaceae bacterium]